MTHVLPNPTTAATLTAVMIDPTTGGPGETPAVVLPDGSICYITHFRFPDDTPCWTVVRRDIHGDTIYDHHFKGAAAHPVAIDHWRAIIGESILSTLLP